MSHSKISSSKDVQVSSVNSKVDTKQGENNVGIVIICITALALVLFMMQ